MMPINGIASEQIPKVILFLLLTSKALWIYFITDFLEIGGLRPIINSIKTIQPHHLLDEKFHTDRLQIDNHGKVIGFISIKPNSFYSNFLQYQDVFAGLQVITNLTGIKWKIYYMNGDSFKLMDMTTLNQEQQNIILNLTVKYNENEIFEISQILNTLQYNLLLT